jgi:hypothetical protein
MIGEISDTKNPNTKKYVEIIEACPKYIDPATGEVDGELKDWCYNHTNEWDEAIVDLGIFTPEFGLPPGQYQISIIGLNSEFFVKNWTCQGSLVLMNACHSWEFYNLPKHPFGPAQAYIGVSGNEQILCSGEFAYNFFYSMLGIDPKTPSANASDAYDKGNNSVTWPLATWYMSNMYIGGELNYENTYLPGYPNVTVFKK